MEPEVLDFHLALCAHAGERGLAWLLGKENAEGGALAALSERLPETFLQRFCRVRLAVLLESSSPEREGDRVLLLADGKAGFVGELSKRGVHQFRRFRTRAPGELSARLHEIYVQLERDKAGQVKRRNLVALPTFLSRAST